MTKTVAILSMVAPNVKFAKGDMHVVCRPRHTTECGLTTDEVGEFYTTGFEAITCEACVSAYNKRRYGKVTVFPHTPWFTPHAKDCPCKRCRLKDSASKEAKV